MVFVKTFQTQLGWFWTLRTIVVDFFIATLLTFKYIFTLFIEHFEDEKSLMYVSQVCFSTKWKNSEHSGKLIAFFISELNNLFFTKITKVPRREDEVERQKNTGKIQMWKRDQSNGILEAKGRKKMQTT